MKQKKILFELQAELNILKQAYQDMENHHESELQKIKTKMNKKQGEMKKN